MIDDPETERLLCVNCENGNKLDSSHTFLSTRLRIANLCCAGEEKIIRTVLASMTGIEKVDINVIGRYAIIKHW